MSTEEIALILLWVAVGIVAGFALYSYVGPSSTTTAAAG